MKQMKTITGSPFQYKEHPDGEIIVYSSDSDGNLQEKSAIAITPYTIRLVKNAIKQRGRIIIGASRDAPPSGSLGELIKADKQSPQQLSYLIPILVAEEFCQVYRDGQTYGVKLTG